MQPPEQRFGSLRAASRRRDWYPPVKANYNATMIPKALQADVQDDRVDERNGYRSVTVVCRGQVLMLRCNLREGRRVIKDVTRRLAGNVGEVPLLAEFLQWLAEGRPRH